MKYIPQFEDGLFYMIVWNPNNMNRACKSRENEAGAVGGRKSIFSMLT